MSILIGNEEYPSDIRDVQKMISVDAGLKELIDFDNNMLFPYIEKLLGQLKTAVEPSPMAFYKFSKKLLLYHWGNVLGGVLNGGGQ